MPSTTINYSAQVGQNFAYCVGVIKQLRDASGVRRDATTAECNAFIRVMCKQVIIDIMGAEANKAALAAVVPPQSDFT